MTKRKFIASLALVNILAATIFGGSLYILNRVLETRRAAEVKGELTTDLIPAADGQFTFSLNELSTYQYFAWQRDGEVKLLRYGEGEAKQVLQFDLVDFVTPVKYQIAKVEGRFIYSNVGATGNEIIELSADKSSKRLHITAREITSLLATTDKLYFLEVDKSGLYNLYQLDRLAGTSSRLAQFSSTDHFFLTAVDHNQLSWRNLSAVDCRVYRFASQEVLAQACTPTEEKTNGSQYTIVRQTIDHNAPPAGGYSILDVPESLPKLAFKEFVYLTEEYKEKGSAAKALFTGARNEDLQIIHQSGSSQILFLVHSEETDKGYLVELAGVETTTINLPQANNFYYLGADSNSGLLFFDFYRQHAAGRVSSLYTYQVIDQVFTEIDLPECPINNNICVVHHLP